MLMLLQLDRQKDRKTDRQTDDLFAFRLSVYLSSSFALLIDPKSLSSYEIPAGEKPLLSC